MKATFIKSFVRMSLICFISLLLGTCKPDHPCHDITCYNGGIPTKTCSCNCPTGFTGDFCERKIYFVKFKVNGVDWKFSGLGYHEVIEPTGTYRVISSISLGGSEKIFINFYDSLSAGTYHSDHFTHGDFVGNYLNNSSDIYTSISGTLVLTNVTDYYEGTFNFIGKINPSSKQDSIVVTEGSFCFR